MKEFQSITERLGFIVHCDNMKQLRSLMKFINDGGEKILVNYAKSKHLQEVHITQLMDVFRIEDRR